MAEFLPKEYTYHLEDSKPILSDMYTPDSYSPLTSTYKTLILYHSGGLVSANRRAIPAPIVTSVQRQGWLVISPDFHALPESGLQDIRNDVAALENWLLKNHNDIGVDLDRVAIGGFSSGSFVAMLSYKTWKTIHPKAFLNIYGMLDTTSTWYSTPKYLQATLFGGMLPFAIIDAKNYEKFFEPGHPRIWDDQSNPMDIVGRPELFLSLLKEGKITSLLDTDSPLSLLGPSFPPTLSIHGSADTFIPLSDSQALKAALDKLGVENELVVVEGAEHGLEPADARAEEWKRAVEWLERWV